jgi:uncharacterized protein (DUF2267 family)
MSVDVFDTTVHKTYEWLQDLMQRLGWDSHQKAYLALRGTLHALRDRLPVEMAAKLSAQLPMLIRGIYFEGWQPAITPIKVKTVEEFFLFVASYFNNTNLIHEDDIEKIVKAVFQVIANHISPGEIYHIKQTLPFPIAELWPSIDADLEQGKRR